MSDRAEIIVAGEQLAIHHLRWGAAGLFDALMRGPAGVRTCIEMAEPAVEVIDQLAGVVLDERRKILSLAGAPEAIGAARVAVEVAPAIAVAWPGWEIRYAPAHVLAPLVAAVAEAGHTLASPNDPALLDPDWLCFAHTARASAPKEEALHPASIGDTRGIDELDLSVRAANELRNSGLNTVGEVAALSWRELLRLGLSERALREIQETLAS